MHCNKIFILQKFSSSKNLHFPNKINLQKFFRPNFSLKTILKNKYFFLQPDFLFISAQNPVIPNYKNFSDLNSGVNHHVC